MFPADRSRARGDRREQKFVSEAAVKGCKTNCGHKDAAGNHQSGNFPSFTSNKLFLFNKMWSPESWSKRTDTTLWKKSVKSYSLISRQQLHSCRRRIKPSYSINCLDVLWFKVLIYKVKLSDKCSKVESGILMTSSSSSSGTVHIS